MKTRTLGPNGPAVSAIGLGCMGMSAFYGASDEGEALATLDHAIGRGVTFWDTAEMYGPHTNELLLGQALKGRRDHVFVATKFGIHYDPERPLDRAIDGRPENVRASVEGSLKRLGTDHIDLYYQHRMDPDVPVEDTIGAMAELVQQGKVRYLGLSEASANTLRRAHRVHPITALQSEYSLWSRDPERDGTLAACAELGVGFVPYSPLGRGFLTGAIRKLDDLAVDDFRRQMPRLQGDNLDRNLALADEVKVIASDKGCTPSQLAIAWVLAQGEHIVPIPGTRRSKYLDENIGALDVALTASDLERLDAIFTPAAVAGQRYNATGMALVNR